MKKQVFKITSLTVMLLWVLLSSCSRDRRTERRLERVQNWQIAQITYQKAQTAGFAVFTAKVATEYNCGTMVFDRNGTGSYNYMLDGQQRVGTFTWTCTAENLSFNYAAASTTGAQAASYNILNQTRTSITLQGSEAMIDGAGTYALNATFYLNKQ